MRTLFAFLFFAAFALASCDKPQPPAQTAPAPPAVAQTESGEPLAATPAIQVQRVYVAWHLTTQTGGIQRTGGTWVQTKAFLPVPIGQTVDPTQLINDLIRALTSDGILNGVDLSLTAKNRLEITGASLAVRETMILESWLLPVKPK